MEAWEEKEEHKVKDTLKSWNAEIEWKGKGEKSAKEDFKYKDQQNSITMTTDRGRQERGAAFGEKVDSILDFLSFWGQ